MTAASLAIQRPSGAKLLVCDGSGNIRHLPRSAFVSLLHPGDLVIANDAATLPASLSGTHLPTGRFIEIRLAGGQARCFKAVVFGEGGFRTRTEDRPLPPTLAAGDCLQLGPLRATVTEVLNHPRLIELRFEGAPREVWEGIARHGRPIQYSHVQAPLAIWDTWTPIAGLPVAFEPPSAGFILDWNAVQSMAARGVRFATLTHAAGISSTGDSQLDAMLPFDEPYRIPSSTAAAIRQAQERGGSIVAIGTTVVRALEHAGAPEGLILAGDGVATQRIGPKTSLRIVDAIVSGTHEPGTSHYELLRAFADKDSLTQIDRELNLNGYRTHEFGDSVFIRRQVRYNARPGLASRLGLANRGVVSS